MADFPTPGPKSNSDFRRLLSTPARASTDGDDRGRFRRPAKPTGRLDLEDHEQQKEKERKAKENKARHKMRKQKEAEEQKYRDRAKERRDGANPDYEAGAELRPAGFQSVAPPEGVSSEEMRKKEIEESKYLGGDMEHTHLVKGLDYSLLHKIRSELEKEKRMEAEEEDQEEVTKEAAAPAKPVFRTPLAQSVHHLLFEQNDFMIKHRVELGRENGKVRPVDRFMKGRTTFVFDMTDLSAELPTTLLRSKEDCPKIQERMVGSINEDVLKRVTKIMSYLRPRERRKKDKKAKKPKDRDHDDAGGEGRDRAAPMDVAVEVEEKKPAEKTGVAPDLTDLMSLGFLKPVAKTNAQPKALEEDSIFPDVGDYVCLPTAEQIEKTRLKKLAEMEAKKQEAAAAAAADAQTIKTEKAQEKEEFEGDEEEMALLRELMGKQQPQQTSSLHERELKYREQTKGKDYFGNVKDDGEEEEEEVYVPKLKIKDAAADAVKPPPVAHPGGTDDTNEVEMELEDDEGVPTLPPSTATYPAYPEPCAGPQMPAMPGPGYPEAAPYPEAPYPEPYPAGGEEAWAYPNTDEQYGAGGEAGKKAAPDVAMVKTKTLSEQEKKDRGMATVFRRDDSVLKRKTTDKRELDPSFVSENYTECYPGAYESSFTTAVVEEGDSDDDDLSKMDMGTKARKRIKPWHFESDAAWNKFNDTLEATPKAAYQFGVKMGDGRKKDLKKNAKKSKEAKINQELQKINNLMSKRKPGGQ